MRTTRHRPELPVAAATLGLWLAATAGGCGFRHTRPPERQASGQAGHDRSSMPGMSDANTAPGEPAMPEMKDAGAADGAMAHEHLGMGLHMKMTAPRPRTAEDQRRAAVIVQTLRGALEKYRDHRVAVADGFAPFLPHIRQPMVHYTSWRNAVRAQFVFDPARPTSLLYRPVGEGFALIGAMYTAPRRCTESQLDARVPLSITAWHQHVNICLPPLLGLGLPTPAWRRFGPNGSITTAGECRASGGTFRPVIYGWMVHVYPFEEDAAKIWAH